MTPSDSDAREVMPPTGMTWAEYRQLTIAERAEAWRKDSQTREMLGRREFEKLASVSLPLSLAQRIFAALEGVTLFDDDEAEELEALAAELRERLPK